MNFNEVVQLIWIDLSCPDGTFEDERMFKRRRM